LSISAARKARKREKRCEMRRTVRVLDSEHKDRKKMGINDPTLFAVLKRVAG